MKSHKNRLDKLSQQLPEDERVLVIVRLAWPEDEAQQPVTYRRGADGVLIKKVGYDSVLAHLRGAEVNVLWDDEELDVEELL